MGVRDRVAVVTGSGQGIGAGVAEKLAAEGARVVVNDVVPERAEAVASHIREAGGQAVAVVADVGRKEGAEQLASRALEAFGQVDILVNNAGIARDRWLVKMSEEDWDEVLRVNLKSQFLCCQAVVPLMTERRYGRIINVSSRAWLGGPGRPTMPPARVGW